MLIPATTLRDECRPIGTDGTIGNPNRILF